MPRAVAVYRDLKCHSCSARWSQHVWGYDELWTKPREILVCPNADTVCSTPHIEVLPRWDRAGRHAQCRSEQRAAVYLMPDGTVSVPATNHFDDELAVAAVRSGGVRYEFPSVRSMQAFQRDHRRADEDEFTDRCMVIDYDQPTIKRGDTLIREDVKREDRERQKVYDRQLRGEIHFGGEYYENAKRDYLRRTGRG